MRPQGSRIRWVAPWSEPERGRAFADDVREGLGARPKRLSCVFLYDDAGSRLFDEITTLPEYYVTRAEREILVERGAEIARLVPQAGRLVELGSGSSDKTRCLIGALLDARGGLEYAPIDVSRGALERACRRLLIEFPRLRVTAVAADYQAGLRALSIGERSGSLIAWLGSSIGNLDRAEAARFLAHVRERMGERDALLVGIDLRKDENVLARAYDDAAGVTARFNRNLLARINRELGGRFEPERFAHRAVVDGREGCVSMHLVAEEAHAVAIEALAMEARFERGESIRTERSYKYSLDEIEALAAAAGLAVRERWLDGGARFSLNLFARAG